MKTPLSRTSAFPVRLTRAVLLAAVFGFAFRGHAVYGLLNQQSHGDMAPFWAFVHGTAPAPFQYRPGAILTAGWLYVHFDWPLRYGFSLLDLLGSSVALLLGYELLRRRRSFREAGSLLQSTASASYLTLVLFFVCWQDFYKKPETQPAAGLAMLLLWLWSSPESGGSRWLARQPWLSASLILLLTLTLCLLRADLAVCLALGALGVAVSRKRGELSLRRMPAMMTAGLCVGLPLATQLLLMKVVYPHAGPHEGPVFFFPYDVRHPWRFAVFLAYTLPVFWALAEARRRRFAADAAGYAFLLATVPFLALWMAFGRLEEVRIFLPLAVAVSPVTAELVALRAAKAEA